jgi:hypothetical protein
MIPLHLSVYLDAFRAHVRTVSRSYLLDGLKDYLQVCRWERPFGRLRPLVRLLGGTSCGLFPLVSRSLNRVGPRRRGKNPVPAGL